MRARESMVALILAAGLGGAGTVGPALGAAWYQHWIVEGFTAVESLLRDDRTGDFCHGDSVSFADLCLVPQVYNARRFKCPMEAFPNITRIVGHCNSLDAFIQALPENQPDAP